MAQPETIYILMRHAARWAVAAEQDREPLIKALHANYAVAYILALREVASDCEVYMLTGYDPYALFLEVLRIQDEATHQIATMCPHLIPQTPLAIMAGEA